MFYKKITFKVIISFLIILFLFITTRGIASCLNQERLKLLMILKQEMRLKLNTQIHYISSKNEWKKYEMNENFSLEYIENYAKNFLNMCEVDKNKIEMIYITDYI